jgi:hypothetical protein
MGVIDERENYLFEKNIWNWGTKSKRIGEAPLGICFPLKVHSSYPMHPVPHFSQKIALF